ncbi:MAG: hypothetical protein ACLSAF_04940 [Intestinimonas sp.]
MKDANLQVVSTVSSRRPLLQTTFAIMLALVNNQCSPRFCPAAHLGRILTFQGEIIIRRTVLTSAAGTGAGPSAGGPAPPPDNIDEVIKIIRTAYDNAKENLMSVSIWTSRPRQSAICAHCPSGPEPEKLENECTVS